MRNFLPTAGLVILLGFPQGIAAQRLSAAAKSWSPSVALASTNRPALMKSGDYRLEGTIVGGVLLGAAGLWIGAHGCGGPGIPEAPPPSCTSTTLAVGAVGVAVGAGLGYLLGWSLTKYRQVDAQ